MSKEVVIFGAGRFTDMIYYDAKNHDDFHIAAITVDEEYRNGDSYLGLPLIAFEEIEKKYPPSDYDMLLVASCQNDMRIRRMLFSKIKNKGYALRNYISPKSDCAEVEMGENNIVMAFAHVGLYGIMGNDNLVRQHVYLGHDFNLKDHIVIAPGCRIGGNCLIEEFSYIGLGVIINDGKKIREESFIGSGSVVIRDTEKFSINVGNPSRIIKYKI